MSHDIQIKPVVPKSHPCLMSRTYFWILTTKPDALPWSFHFPKCKVPNLDRTCFGTNTTPRFSQGFDSKPRPLLSDCLFVFWKLHKGYHAGELRRCPEWQFSDLFSFPNKIEVGAPFTKKENYCRIPLTLKDKNMFHWPSFI